jgi:hypothetical protein
MAIRWSYEGSQRLFAGVWSWITGKVFTCMYGDIALGTVRWVLTLSFTEQ